MKITGVKTTLCRNDPASNVECCVIELTTDESIVGVAFGPPAIHHTIIPIVDRFLVNADPRAVSSLWQQLTQANISADGTLTSTIAALDIALWDLKAKNNNEPLWKTLGGLRPRVNSHARIPRSVDDPNTLRVWWDSIARPLGLRGIVLSSSGQPHVDADALNVVKAALRDSPTEIALMLDAHERWTPKEAIRAVRHIERDIDLTWIEAPVPHADFPGIKRVSAAIRSAVCAGGKLTSLNAYLPLLHHRAINVVQIDTARVGISGALQIADAAYGFELPIALTRSPGNLHAHLASVLPSYASMEICDRETPVSIATADVRISDGWAIAGDRAGHGLVIDQAALHTLTIGEALTSAP